jgi:hypothetical protein
MLRGVSRWALALAGLSTLCGGVGCDRSDQSIDRVPPRVVSVSPALPIVPVTTEFTVVFSETIDAGSVDEDPTSDTVSIVIVPRANVSSTFLSDFNSPPLIESRQSVPIPVDVDVDGDRLFIRPELNLLAQGAYTLLVSSEVSDKAGNPLVDNLGLKSAFRYDFDTDEGAPAVSSTDLGNGLVAPNRRRLTITFNQAVSNVGESTVSFSPAVPIEAVLLDEARVNATVVIADSGGCERLSPSTTYTLRVGAGVVADSGQTLEPFEATFDTGAACDLVPHVILDGPEAIAGDVSATVRYATSKASTTAVRFGVVGGPLDCLGGTCPIRGADVRQPVAGSAPLAFEHAVVVTGLVVDERYVAVVSAEDDVGGTVSASVEFITEALPTVAVNEVMADPIGTENAGEYIELANFGDVDLDLSGHRVLVTGNSTCTATLATPTIIPPGGFLLVVGGSFLAETYNLGGDVLLARSSSANICGSGLLNAGVQVVVVEPSGRPVSSMNKHITPSEGRSTERVSPTASDVASSFCLSRRDVGPTPGRQNGVLAQGCEE